MSTGRLEMPSRKSVLHALTAFVLCQLAGSTQAQPALSSAAPQLQRVDTLERVFPDRWPAASGTAPSLHAPRGSLVSFPFVVRSTADTTCELSVAPPRDANGQQLAARISTYHVLPVPVEANNNGGCKTSPTAIPPKAWLEQFVRKAPFEVCEVLIEGGRVELKAGRTHAVLVQADIPPNATPGIYSGKLTCRTTSGTVSADFAVRVHRTVLPAPLPLHATHWLFAQPRNLTNGEPPAWWSERHWELLANSGKQLRRYGQDTILTPLIDHEIPLIQTIRERDGTYTFDFSRFDRWVTLFLGLGFRRIAGHHIAMLPEKWIYDGVFVDDRKTGKRERLVARGNSNPKWVAFIPLFYQALHEHLAGKGWVELYLQHQLDEPKDERLYRLLAEIARLYLPGVRTIDAINSRPKHFSPWVDTQVFSLGIMAKEQLLAKERAAAGTRSWLYHCCSPYPPHPNRHLDERLTDSRLYPWLAYLLNADGYLYWGANVYRGADPYKTSIGPLPNGSQDPGHPPGDNWMFYPGPDGLRASMRMVAFLDGMEDHALLTKLANTDRTAADAIMARIARSIRDYETTPPAYHSARQLILETLDRLPKQ